MELPSPPSIHNRPEAVKNIHEHVAWHEHRQTMTESSLRGGPYLGTDERKRLWDRLQTSTEKQNGLQLRIVRIIRDAFPPSSCASDSDGDGGGGGGGRSSGRDQRESTNRRVCSARSAADRDGGRVDGAPDTQRKSLSPSIGGVQGTPPRRIRDGVARQPGQSPRRLAGSTFGGSGRGSSPMRGVGRGRGGAGGRGPRPGRSGDDFNRDRSHSSSSRSESRERRGSAAVGGSGGGWGEGQELEHVSFPRNTEPGNREGVESFGSGAAGGRGNREDVCEGGEKEPVARVAPPRRTTAAVPSVAAGTMENSAGPASSNTDVVGTQHGGKGDGGVARHPSGSPRTPSASPIDPVVSASAALAAGSTAVSKAAASSNMLASMPAEEGRGSGKLRKASSTKSDSLASVKLKGKPPDPRVAKASILKKTVDRVKERTMKQVAGVEGGAPPHPAPPFPPLPPNPEPATRGDSDSDMVVDDMELDDGNSNPPTPPLITKWSGQEGNSSSVPAAPGTAGARGSARKAAMPAAGIESASRQPETNDTKQRSSQPPPMRLSFPAAFLQPIQPVVSGTRACFTGAARAPAAPAPVATGQPTAARGSSAAPGPPPSPMGDSWVAVAPPPAAVPAANISSQSPTTRPLDPRAPAPAPLVSASVSIPTSIPALVPSQPAPSPPAIPDIEPIARARAQLDAIRASQMQYNGQAPMTTPTPSQMSYSVQATAATPAGPYLPGGNSPRRAVTYIPGGGGGTGSGGRRSSSAAEWRFPRTAEYATRSEPYRRGGEETPQHDQQWARANSQHLHQAPPGAGGYGDPGRSNRRHGGGGHGS